MNEQVNIPKSTGRTLLYVLLAVTVVVFAINQTMIMNLNDSIGKLQVTAKVTTGSMSSTSSASATGPDVIPKGTPKIYGTELGINYDDVSTTNQQKADATIRKLGLLDVNIQLSGDNLQRYIKIASQISCEYCCGAESVIFANGQAACGCAHSYAMRGVAKYLISKHGSEFTDDEILEEMGKWKTLFFPGKLTDKAKILQQEGIELNYINLASNKYRDIEKGKATSSGGMVGGC